MLFVTAALLAYLVGSIPFGLLIARWVKGVDLRQAGSGNIGATNATRVLGRKWGIIVLLLDAAKGAFPTGSLPLLLPFSDDQQLHAAVLAALCAVLGHMFSPWLRFKGGKGVATAMGAVLVLAPTSCLIAFVTFLLVVVATRIVSLGSMTAALSFAIAQWIVLQPAPWSRLRWSLTAFSLGVPALIIFQHRANIRRLLRGEEHAFRKKSPVVSPPPTAPEVRQEG